MGLDPLSQPPKYLKKGKPEQRGLLPGDAGRRVRVAIRRQNLVDNVLLDEAQRAPRRGVVSVGDAARTWRDAIVVVLRVIFEQQTHARDEAHERTQNTRRYICQGINVS